MQANISRDGCCVNLDIWKMDYSISCVCHTKLDKCKPAKNTDYHDNHIHILIYKRHFKELLDRFQRKCQAMQCIVIVVYCVLHPTMRENIKALIISTQSLIAAAQ